MSLTIKHRNREVKLRAQCCSTRNISQYFKISEEMFLTTANGEAEFPDETGKFNLHEFDASTIFTVSLNNSIALPTVPSQASNDELPTPALAATPATVRRRTAAATVRVVRADIDSETGKPANLLYYNLTAHICIYSEEEASVPFILGKVKSSFGEDDLLLVGPNGLILYDQEGTRGITFWKIGSRKVFAVKEEDITSRRLEESSRSSSPLPKRRRHSENGHCEEVLGNLITEVSSVREQLKAYKKLAFRHKFSLSFLQAMDETFCCCICKRVPPRLPLTACQVCCSLVGCQSCTDQWYGGVAGLNKPCPKCRASRGLSKSFHLKGFDSFVDQIAEMQGSESNDENSFGQLDDTLPIVIPPDEENL